ncbi:MAG: hypothetical protein ACAI43_02390 [Phycisphaerae bacterium]|nr:hypothetical protein [Tepidisphaeraceae bacterium]
MTTLHDNRKARHFRAQSNDAFSEKRKHRRYDLGGQTLMVNKWDSRRRSAEPLGYLMDLSAGGVRVRINEAAENIKADSQIRVRLELPTYAGICPFVDTTSENPTPKSEWVGWLSVSRVSKAGEKQADVSGQLVDMDEMDRGMLGLYLSTQPLAA